MRLIILGSGSAGGIPRKGHRDPICVDARRPGSKSRRRRSSTLLRHRGRNILIDVSPDFLSQIKRAGILRIDAILLTHAHADATGGLRDFRAWKNHSQILKNLRMEHAEPVPLYAHPATIRALRRGRAAIEPHSVRPFATACVAGIPIRFIPVNHGMRGIATYGFLIGRRLFYASDMDGTSPRAVRLIRGTRTLVLDGAFWMHKRLRGHFAVPQTLVFAKSLRPQRLFITQSGHSFPPHDVAQRAICRLARKQNCAFPTQLAYDGLRMRV